MEDSRIAERPVFVDSHDPPRQWLLQVRLSHVREIQSLYPDFRLERILVENARESSRISEDMVLLCAVVEILLRDQMRDRSVSLEELLGSITGDNCGQLYRSLVSAVANFCQSRVAKAQARQIIQILDAIEQLDHKVGQELEISSGISSGSAPPASEKPLGGTHSGSYATSPTQRCTGEPSLSESIPQARGAVRDRSTT